MMHKRFRLLAAIDLCTLVVKVGEEFHKEVEMVVAVAKIHTSEAIVAMIHGGEAMVVKEEEMVGIHINVLVEVMEKVVAVVMEKAGEECDSGVVAAVMRKAGEGIDSGMTAVVIEKVGEGIDSGMATIVMKKAEEGIHNGMVVVVVMVIQMEVVGKMKEVEVKSIVVVVVNVKQVMAVEVANKIWKMVAVMGALYKEVEVMVRLYTWSWRGKGSWRRRLNARAWTGELAGGGNTHSLITLLNFD